MPTAGTPWRGHVVPVGLTPAQHLAAAQHALGEFLKECVEEGWTLTSRPRLALRRLELDDDALDAEYEILGRPIRLSPMNVWMVEADAER